MLESNPPRNSRLETRLYDEAGALAAKPAPLSVDRFSDASENSYRKLPRSGILLVSLELGGRHVAQRGVQPFLVVDLFEELADGSASVGQVAVFVAQHLFVLERFYERLAGRVVPRIAFARHTDLDAVCFEQVRVVLAGVLRTPIGMMYQPGFGNAARECHTQRGQG